MRKVRVSFSQCYGGLYLNEVKVVVDDRKSGGVLGTLG